MSSRLRKTLRSLDKAKSVNMCYEGLSAEDVSMLAHALNSNTSVTSITLIGNLIDDKGASALAEALK
jgi:Ran GTPase-activating protein (RanGAP) involved in mRNA processing and transport